MMSCDFNPGHTCSGTLPEIEPPAASGGSRKPPYAIIIPIILVVLAIILGLFLLRRFRASICCQGQESAIGPPPSFRSRFFRVIYPVHKSTERPAATNSHPYVRENRSPTRPNNVPICEV